MRLPVITGTIERRILVNYRVDPGAIVPLVPPPFRPKVVRGWAVAGICLIRLGGMRPLHFPRWLGLASENKAHRVAVQWESPDGIKEGVYVRRRDTSSRLNCLAGGRLFPGVQHHARFRVRETASQFEVAIESDDRRTSMAVKAELAHEWPRGSIFDSLADASAFFQAGSLGYSPAADSSPFQAMELTCRNWRVEPLVVHDVRSSLFDDQWLFPPGSVEFDCALLMRGIEHQWRGRGDLLSCPARNATEGVPYSAAASGKDSPIAAA
jgi:hypothetical protein